MMPPKQDSTTASTRNCISTSFSSAPMASRVPISRVRSVTDTSMMFMMPMPPTSRLTAATAASRPVSTRVELGQGLHDFFHVPHIEIIFLAVPIRRRSRIRVSTSFLNFFRGNAVFCGEIDGGDILVARNAPLKRGDGNQHNIVLILPETGLALGFQHPDHLKGEFLKANGRAQGILSAEEFFAHRGPQDTDGLPGPDVALGERCGLTRDPSSSPEERHWCCRSRLWTSFHCRRWPGSSGMTKGATAARPDNSWQWPPHPPL